jgi:hypothetical protein
MTSSAATPFPRRAAALAVAATLALALLAVWLIYGTTTFYTVDIRWRPEVAESQRRDLVRRLSLYPVGEREPGTLIYILEDMALSNLAAIVRAPGIARVDDLDPVELTATNRNTLEIARWLSIRYPRVARIRSLDDLVRRAALVPLFFTCLMCVLASSRQGRTWLVERVPRMSPEALGLARIAFAFSLAGMIDYNVRDPAARAGFFALLGLFAIGLAARVVFVAFVVMFTRVHLAQLQDHALALPTSGCGAPSAGRSIPPPRARTVSRSGFQC